MPGYSNPNASSVVDVYPAGNIDLSAGGPTSQSIFKMGNAAIYGVQTGNYTVALAVDIAGDIASNANCKIRVEVNGNLKEEKTYTSAQTNPEYSFECAADDEVTVTYSTNAAGLEQIDLIGTRWIVKAGVAA